MKYTKMLPVEEKDHKIVKIISAHSGKQIKTLVVEAIQLLYEKYNKNDNN
jgi:hypothetical protein